jgi:hypothetical protein
MKTPFSIAITTVACLIVCFLLTFAVRYIILACTPLSLVEVDTTRQSKFDVIPKTIFCFWDTSNPPEFITSCIDTWRKHNPSFGVHLLTPDNLENFLPDAKKILTLPYANTPQRLSDFVRLHVTYRHGGFWIDASMLINGKLDSFLKKQLEEVVEFVGFYIDKFTKNAEFPVIENWFFGCVKNSPFVKAWRDVFMTINGYNTVYTFVDHAKAKGVKLWGIKNPYYLSMHVACQIVLQKYGYNQSTLRLLKAENCPLKYLVDAKWNHRRAVDSLIRNKGQWELLTKIRGLERELLIKRNDLFD